MLNKLLCQFPISTTIKNWTNILAICILTIVRWDKKYPGF